MRFIKSIRIAILLSFTISLTLHHPASQLEKLILAQSYSLITEAQKRIGFVPGVQSVLKTIERQKDVHKKGHLYELLIALDYKARGYEIIALNKRMSAVGKTREFDVLVRKEGIECWIECKASQWDRIPAKGSVKLYRQFEDQVLISNAFNTPYLVHSYYPMNKPWGQWLREHGISFLVHDHKYTAARSIHL